MKKLFIDDSPSMVIEDPVTEHLKKAKALIEKGWCRGTARRGESFCAVGAMFAVCGGYDPIAKPYEREIYQRMIERVSDRLLSADPSRVNRITMFNDTCPDKGPVLALFDRAINGSGT